MGIVLLSNVLEKRYINLVHSCFYVFVTDAVHMRNNDQPIVFKTSTTDHAVDHINLTQYMTGPNKQYVIKCEQNDKTVKSPYVVNYEIFVQTCLSIFLTLS